MRELVYGSLFTGSNGLSMGVQQVLPGRTAWVCDNDKAASRLLSQRYSHAPNLGSILDVDWRNVEPVDVLEGGSPCQDLSISGNRKGMTDGTRSNLWASMREGIAVLRPQLVVWENVRGALSAKASSDVEQCPGCVGNRAKQHPLRALGRVLGDLADLGYDARWYGLRAADVGAAHERFRVFLFATAADADCSGWGEHRRPLAVPPEQPAAEHARADAAPGLTLFPTPAVNDMGASYDPQTWDDWTARMKAKHNNGNGHGRSLSIEAQRLMPPPTTSDGNGPQLRDVPRGLNLRTAVASRDWGTYAAAIANAEHATGRAAPAPTEPGPKGPRLSPAFVEWLMMLPAGHVTDPAAGLSRNQQLKMLGNGVVPAQAAAATQMFVNDITTQPNRTQPAEDEGVALPARPDLIPALL